MEGWQGRVDFDDDQEAFRWHQIVRELVRNGHRKSHWRDSHVTRTFRETAGA